MDRCNANHRFPYAVTVPPLRQICQMCLPNHIAVIIRPQPTFQPNTPTTQSSACFTSTSSSNNVCVRNASPESSIQVFNDEQDNLDDDLRIIETSKNGNNSERTDRESIDEDESDNVDDEVIPSVEDNVKNLYFEKMTRSQCEALVYSWMKYNRQLQSSKGPEYWTKITEAVNIAGGPRRTKKQCKRRMRDIIKKYRAAKKDLATTGRSLLNPKYFYEIDSILGTRNVMTIPAVQHGSKPPSMVTVYSGNERKQQSRERNANTVEQTHAENESVKARASGQQTINEFGDVYSGNERKQQSREHEANTVEQIHAAKESVKARASGQQAINEFGDVYSGNERKQQSREHEANPVQQTHAETESVEARTSDQQATNEFGDVEVSDNLAQELHEAPQPMSQPKKKKRKRKASVANSIAKAILSMQERNATLMETLMGTLERMEARAQERTESTILKLAELLKK